MRAALLPILVATPTVAQTAIEGPLDYSQPFEEFVLRCTSVMGLLADGDDPIPGALDLMKLYLDPLIVSQRQADPVADQESVTRLIVATTNAYLDLPQPGGRELFIEDAEFCFEAARRFTEQ